jgi:NitT/TauT family transport system substrate-binding protein
VRLDKPPNHHLLNTALRLTGMGLLAVSLLVGGAACPGTAPHRPLDRIALAIGHWPGDAPVHVAREKGYFAAEGLEVTLTSFQSGHLGLAAMLSGKADLATVGETPIALAALDGKPVAVVATIATIDRAILIIARRDRGISAAADLRGKKIGVAAGTTADFFLHIYLTTSRISPKDVHVADLPPEKVVDALLNGDVDAVSTWAPYSVELRDRLAGNAVVLSDPAIYTMTWNLVATPDFLKSHPERVEKLLRALIRANRFIADRPTEARAITSRNLGAESGLFEREWRNYHFAAVLDQSLIESLEDQARWMIGTTGAARQPPNFLHLVQPAPLRSVRPEAVTIPGR